MKVRNNGGMALTRPYELLVTASDLQEAECLLLERRRTAPCRSGT